MAQPISSSTITVNSDIASQNPELTGMKPGETSRKQLMAFMRGTKIMIPDYQPLLSHWPARENKGTAELRERVHEWLESTFSSSEDAKRLNWLKKSVIYLFPARWCPHARFEALLVITHMMYWLFAWDDETDSAEFSSIIESLERSSAFRDESIRYVEAVLCSSSAEVDPESISSNHFITFFRPIGEAVKANYTEDQTQSFLREVKLYMQTTGEEHRNQMTRDLPTVDQYLEMRMGSSGVGICLALNEYGLDIQLPREVLQSEPMRIIWHETNMITAMCEDPPGAFSKKGRTDKFLTYRMNDVYSIKKELDQNQVDTLIPLLTLSLGSAGRALDAATAMVRSSIGRFDAAERALLGLFAGREDVRRLHSGRYKLRVDATSGGAYVTL
ncbi:terpenoid synthase [Camillea tinctor]|nr:terpenoid synthase [Camillea tinctor]